MLEELKTALRITHNKLDDDLTSNINACKADMARVGVNIDDFDNNKLSHKAVELYVKWQYDYCGKGDQFRQNYESLRDSMSLSNKYNGGDNCV